MKMIIDLFRPSTRPFIKVLKEYFTSISPGKADGTLEKYEIYYRSIEKFFKSRYSEYIQLHEIKVRHMEEMRAFLHAEKKITAETASRRIEHCQAAYDYAVLLDYIKYNPIDAIKSRRDKVPEPVSLEIDEIKKIMNHKFSSDKRNLVIDLFLFQCFTGLSYMDLWTFDIEKDHMVENGIRHDVFFVTSKLGRGKNNKPYAAEFNKYARDIYNKYAGNFPRITNQGYNKILKKIAFTLNIDKDLSTHNARKTYSTLRYNQGMSLEALSDELGNTPDILRKHYITNSRERIKRDIRIISDTPLLG